MLSVDLTVHLSADGRNEKNDRVEEKKKKKKKKN
jgi:hypothetical protein